MPGVSMSTRKAVMPRWRESGSPVRVSSTQRSEYWARLVHTFWPLIRTTSTDPPGTARHASDDKSLPVPGSENP